MWLVIPSTTVLRVFALTGMDKMILNFTSLAAGGLAPGVLPSPARGLSR